jgi:amino acid efflux transporter
MRDSSGSFGDGLPVEAPGATLDAGIPRRRIGTGQGVALYLSAVVGAGVLVLPGQTASLAGPAVLVAWAFSCLLGALLAATFAALASRMPDAGGVATYTTAAFGQRAGGVTGWWYLAAGSVGQTVVPLTGGYYLADALGVGERWAYLIAGSILAVALCSNLSGIWVSAGIQVALAIAIGVILFVASVAGISHAEAGALSPFAPHGLSGVGKAVVVLFFAFAGWEAVAHLAGEFRDPRRDLPRATAITVVLVSVLYLAVAVAVVVTRSYGTAQLDHLAVGRLLSRGLGLGAIDAAAGAALAISLGTTNAFVASVSRLAYALAREDWLPRPIRRLSHRDVPTGGVWLVTAVGGAGLVVAWVERWGTQQIVLMPATLVLGVYLIATASAVKLIHGPTRTLAVAALVLSACAVPFSFVHLPIPAVVAIAALAYRRSHLRRLARSARTARRDTRAEPADHG